MREGRRLGLDETRIGTCWKAEKTVEMALELGYFRSRNALLSQRALRCVTCSEYAASAGDPIVMKKFRTSSRGSGRAL